MDMSVKVLIVLAFAALGECEGAACGGKERHWHGHRYGRELAIVSRDEWGARPPNATEVMANPVPYVIIHHSYIPPACTTPDACVKAMQTMQDMHQKTNGWDDIGYNFAVGGDGHVYMGRGWMHAGAHAPTYNDKSIGICFIGDWTKTAPPPEMLEAGRELIAYGLRKGHIAADYELFGHRQVRETECPGDAFFEEISQWPHWSAHAPYIYIPTTTEVSN